MTRYVTAEEVKWYHRELVALQDKEPLLIAGGDEELDGALARPQATFGGEDLLPTLAEKAAALLQSITIAHPFIDGNKRAAIGAALLFLELNGVSQRADEDGLYDLVIAVTTGALRENADIAARLRELFTELE